MNRHIRIAAFSFLLLLPIAALLYSVYQDAMRETIDHLVERQDTLATQAASCLHKFFLHKINTLCLLANNQHIIDMDDRGRQLMESFQEAYFASISAIARLDAEGRVIQTYPNVSLEDDVDIFRQEHFQQLLEKPGVALSDVCGTIQGYKTVALYMPAFDDKGFAGGISILIPVEKIAREYLDQVRIGQEGFTSLFNREGRILFCPVYGPTDRSILEAGRHNPSLNRMLQEMLQGKSGSSVYYDTRPGAPDGKKEKMRAVFRPVPIANTFWMVMISTPESEATGVMKGFSTKILLLSLLLITAVTVSLYNLWQASNRISSQERRIADEIRLKRNAGKYRTALEAVGYGAWEWNLVTGEIFHNDWYLLLAGFKPRRLWPKEPFWEEYIHPDDQQNAMARFRDCIENRLESYEAEYRMRMADGEWTWVQAKASAVTRDIDGHALIMAGTHSDIAERKKAEQALLAALEEKESLLKEVHHRVKNNLQVIISLLSLQGRHVKDPGIVGALEDLRNRVNTMALIHETLYRSENFSRIGIRDYSERIVTEHRKLHPENISVSTEIAEATITLYQATAYGLVLNELLTNAYKHAFPGRSQGRVRVTVRRLEGDMLELAVADDGVGMPENLRRGTQDTLGLQLISLLATGQLKGRLDITVDHGTTFTVLFPLHAEKTNPAAAPEGRG